MDLPLLVAGAALLVVMVLDAVVTTVATTTKTGPVSRLVGLGLRRCLRRLAPRPDSAPMVAAGPLIFLTLVGTWIAGIWVGWALVFTSHPEAVLADTTGRPTTALSDVVYFAGTAIATLGTADLHPTLTCRGSNSR